MGLREGVALNLGRASSKESNNQYVFFKQTTPSC
jgi:hypothetical protein